ncbi:MAG: reverse transcriptase domain-containing protein [Candidatus Gracilibacteria bacterium]|nr:reverse transcriptase domain-containing protein [Candidatus Gracilibacteria bacterium]
MIQKQLLYDLFQSYYDARKNKRNTINSLDFEFRLEENLINLYEELISGKYEVGKSIYFIQTHPVKREIFAGNFRDRIVHHLIYNYISPIFEKNFIYDSYSCRKGKGTSFGIKRIEKFIRSCSENYKEDCYILKLDISGYFMSIDKDILFEKIEKILKNYYSLFQREYPQGEGLEPKYIYNLDYNLILNLIKKVIYNDPTKNAIFKGKREDYIGLPKNKSLFFAEPGTGLPIGNLTSQLFSNIYLSDFDKYVKNELKCKYYGRYVDDFIIVHKDKDYLTKLIPIITAYLKENLKLTLHPKKIYLQHYTKGVLFLGAFIKPHRKYIRKRSIGYFYNKINLLNNRIKNSNYKVDYSLKQDFIAILNSYLGMMKHYKTYKLRRKILINQVSAYFWNYFYISGGYSKVKKK